MKYTCNKKVSMYQYYDTIMSTHKKYTKLLVGNTSQQKVVSRG